MIGLYQLRGSGATGRSGWRTPGGERRATRPVEAASRTTERAAQAAIRQARPAFGLGKRAGWNWRDTDAAEDKFRYACAERSLSGALDDIEGAASACLSSSGRRSTATPAAGHLVGLPLCRPVLDRYSRWGDRARDAATWRRPAADDLAKYANPNTLPLGGRWGALLGAGAGPAGTVPQSGMRCATNCRCLQDALPGRPGSRRPGAEGTVPLAEPKYVQKSMSPSALTLGGETGYPLAKGLAEAEEQLLAVVVADLVEQAGSIDPEDRHGSDSV